ncbi:MAG TPA: MBL fold metallo-hydrolase [Acidimicrobiales bacterium]|nr:MBL fold metallo-hydrolase [Acidimicrobiales bacterium]
MAERTDITASELAAELESGTAPLAIVDLRAPGEVARWRVEGDREVPRVERAYWDVLGEPETLAAALPPGAVAVVICAVGNTSAIVADELRSVGVDARNLRDGMAAWSRVHVARTVPGPAAGSYIVQLDRIAKGCLSYVVGTDGGPALVVDPDRHHDEYRAVLDGHRSTLAAVFDTHLHADHVSGAAALAESAGVPYLLTDDAGALRPHRHPGDGEVVFEGGPLTARTVALYAPGHTPGSTGLLVDGRYLLSGDTLFVEGVGRPDLGGHAREWGTELFHTLTERLASLDDGVLVLPAHYQSRRERNPDGIFAALLGDLRRSAEFHESLDDFLADVVAHTAAAPAEYGRIRTVNLGVETMAPELLDELEVGKNQCAAGTTRPGPA